MNKRIVFIIPKNNNLNYIKDYFVFDYADEEDLKENNIQLEKMNQVFVKSYLFDESKSQKELRDSISKPENLIFNRIFNKTDYDPNKPKFEWNNSLFVTYDDSNNILNIEEFTFENAKGIMDSCQLSQPAYGVFLFEGKKFVVNIKMEENLKYKNKIFTDDILFSEDPFHENVIDFVFCRKGKGVFLSKETNKIILEEKLKQLKNIDVNIIEKNNFTPLKDLEFKYKKEVAFEKYTNQIVYKHFLDLFKSKKIDHTVFLNINKICLLGMKRYKQYIKHCEIQTFEYVSNGKVFKIQENSKFKKEKSKIIDLFRKQKSFYKKIKRAKKQRKKIIVLDAHI